MIRFHTQGVAMPPLSEKAIETWVERVAKAHGKRVGAINYIFTSDERILEVNRQFLGHDYYTDIITFDYTEADILSGDLFISLDTVRTNAPLVGATYLDELHRVVIHGVLHLCGIGDKGPGEREKMEAEEDEALKNGPTPPNPYPHTMQEIISFLRACPAYYIATMDGDQPRVRPFSSLCPFEGRLYIESNTFKPFHRQATENPKVEICAFDGQSRWLRIECRLVYDPRVEAKKALLDYMPEIRDLGYDEHDPNMSVYYMDHAVATFYSYTDEPRTISF